MYKSLLTIDVEESDIQKLKIGDKIEATIKGTIKELEGKHEYETAGLCCDGDDGEKETRTIPPRVRVDLDEVKVVQPNEFSALVDDDEDD